MFKSTAFSLKTRDFLRGLIMAVGTPVLILLQELIPHWDINVLYKAAIAAAITYLLKNFVTNDVKVAEKTIEEAAIKQGKDATEEKSKIMRAAFKNTTMMIAAALLSLSIITSSCRVTFVPAANIEMKADVNNGAQKTDALFLKMIGSSDRSFATYSADYADIEAGINSIVLRDSLRTNGKNIYRSAVLLQSHFRTYKADHQTRGQLTTGELSAYMNYLRAFWRPLQIQEDSLK